MSLSLTVTPGTHFSQGNALSFDAMNLAAEPTVQIDDGTITADLLDIDDVTATLAASIRATGYLPWGSFQQQNMASASVSCPVAVKTYPITGWWVTPTGAAVTASFQPLTSQTEDSDDSRSSLNLVAGGALTLLQVGTWLPSGLCQQLGDNQATVSVYVRNRTGTAFTPHLKVYNPTSLDDPNTIGAAVADVTGSSCADSDWVRQTFTFDPRNLTNWSKGAMLVLEVTCGGGVMSTAGSDFILLSDFQVEPGASVTDFIRVPPALPQVPPGTMFPYGGSTAPAGWLLCDGSLVAKAKYPALYAVLGDLYGVSGASFNVPDFRGRVPVGAEVAGASQSRMEISVNITANTSGTAVLTFASGAGAALRLGMGASGHAGLPSGVYITELTDTTATLSANTTASVTGTVRFSKLGGADAETLGSAGNGMSGGRGAVTVVKRGCSTAGSTTLTVPNLYYLACGMEVSSDAGDIPAGTTITAFLSATTVRLSAAAGSSTTASSLVTFTVPAAEGNQWERYEYLKGVITMPATVNAAADSVIDVPTNMAVLNLVGGESVTCANGLAGVQANSYVSALTNSQFTMSPATSGATNGTYDFVFTRNALARATAQTPDTLPAQTVNWIIKH